MKEDRAGEEAAEGKVLVWFGHADAQTADTRSRTNQANRASVRRARGAEQ